MTGPFRGIGLALRALREKRRVTAKEMARRLGIDPSGVSRHEGEHSNPRVETISRYLEVIDADLWELAEQLKGGKRMDPNATLADLLIALRTGDRDAAESACLNLANWISKGGFLPELRKALEKTEGLA